MIRLVDPKLPNERPAGDVPDDVRPVLVRDTENDIHCGYWNDMKERFLDYKSNRELYGAVSWCELSDVLVTTEPPIISRGYVAPAGQGWRPIEELLSDVSEDGEILFDRFGEDTDKLQFIDGSGYIMDYDKSTEYDDEDLFEEFIAYRIAQPLEQAPENQQPKEGTT